MLVIDLEKSEVLCVIAAVVDDIEGVTVGANAKIFDFIILLFKVACPGLYMFVGWL